MLENKATAKDPAGKGVLCAKCEHLNPRGNSDCRKCGAHLYVSCVDCGHRNERLRSRCLSCGRRLHRSFLQRVAKRILPAHGGISPLQFAAFVIGVGLIFGLIVLISTIPIPALW